MALKKQKLLLVASLASTLWVFYRGLIERLREMGYEVTVAASDDYDLGRFERQFGCTVFPINISRRIAPFQDLACMVCLLQLMRKERFDLVHAHTPKGGLIGMAAAFLARVPNRVYTLHGLPMETATGLKRQILRQAERLSLGLATCRLIVSYTLAERAMELKLCQEGGYRILGHGSACGVDRDRFSSSVRTPQRIAQAKESLNISPDAFVIGFVGRVTPDKGIDCLLDVYESIQKKHPKAHLLIIGDFDKLGKKTHQHLDLRIHSNQGIRYLSFIEDIVPCYSAMDMLVLPSKREGFNYALLEAASCGLPTVTTRATGCIDAVIDGQTGLIVEIGDSEGLQKAVETLILSPHLRQAYGAAAEKRIVENFDAQLLVDEHIKLYQSLVDNKKDSSDGKKQ
jgi:glycosyltransferase involved in cell wall biosynthesis